MNEQKTSFSGKRKVAIGGGIAAAAVIVALSTGMFPPSGKDTAGTIVPATRYRAAQPTSDDVKVGNSSGGSGLTGSTAAGGAGDAARGDAAKGDAAKGDAAKGDAAKGDAAKGDAAKGDAARGNSN